MITHIPPRCPRYQTHCVQIQPKTRTAYLQDDRAFSFSPVPFSSSTHSTIFLLLSPLPPSHPYLGGWPLGIFSFLASSFPIIYPRFRHSLTVLFHRCLSLAPRRLTSRPPVADLHSLCISLPVPESPEHHCCPTFVAQVGLKTVIRFSLSSVLASELAISGPHRLLDKPRRLKRRNHPHP